METVYSKVLDRLTEKGWKQGAFGSSSGPNCLLGAAQQVLNSYEVSVFWGEMTFRLASPMNWNDNPQRTFEDVALLLKELHEEAVDA